MSDTESFEQWVEDGVRLIEEHASSWQGWVLVALTGLILLGAPDRMSELLAVTIVTMFAASIMLIVVPGRSRCPACDAVVAHDAVHCRACGGDVTDVTDVTDDGDGDQETDDEDSGWVCGDCGTVCDIAPPIGPYCPSDECETLDGPGLIDIEDRA